MAITWNWNNKIGEMHFDGIHQWNIYKGSNCLYVGIDNNENLCDFWVDDAHAKNCIGLSKDYDNIYSFKKDRTVIIGREFEKDKKALKIALYFLQAGANIIWEEDDVPWN